MCAIGHELVRQGHSSVLFTQVNELVLATSSPFATRGDKELSTKNFNDYSLVGVPVHARLRQQIAVPRGCLHVPGQDRP